MDNFRFGLLVTDGLGDHPALDELVEPGVADLRFLLDCTAIGDDHTGPAVGPGLAQRLAGGPRQHDMVGNATIEEGSDSGG